MYSVYGYFYNNKESIILQNGSKRNCNEFIEAWCIDFISNLQGNKVCDFNSLIKPVGYILTSKEWNKNLRLWINRSNNRSKLTIKLMEKDRGLIYNSYKVTKLVSIYLVDNKRPFKYKERRTTICIF